MKTALAALVLYVPCAAGAEAAGDAIRGEKDFVRCRACHSIVAPDEEVIVKGGVAGPNLWGVVGRTAGSYPDDSYTDEMAALGNGGLVWTPDAMAAYIPDAKAFLQARSGHAGAMTSMTPQSLADVSDVIAFLARYGAE